MARYRIYFIIRDTDQNSFFNILQLGGINNTGDRWTIPAHEAINGINAGLWEFYILEDRNEINVKVVFTELGGYKLVATGMGYLHNLLEDLPEIKLQA
ncbi:hypothetical protein LV84_03242 [Algoriphagus ratkowskyi]|uniref:Uncharacterized protein n=1 Tax=Algoriphagus ratkowskyi TaxID=57028 RepID=A0A2W7QYD3_9BACT|nr:hypothetical protein [Algoriphagus ratkowskyi]PZX53518.1 hypothetical protein LV84_03242 [Algoriphagus ratkowskyi]TXD76454.1 hypothetical protein ESW18_15700 [Algoriphagus ratkowskyi]